VSGEDEYPPLTHRKDRGRKDGFPPKTAGMTMNLATDTSPFISF
jgi:hypothetical protein